MKVEDLAITLRNRSNWEAIDLGFALARQWFIRLWGAWLIAALPVFTLVMTLTYLVNDEIFNSFIFILFWWCKPLYEQPLLYILSRQLFSEPITLRDVIKDYPKVIKPQLGALLLWRRLSLSRSFNNPVAMLEGITGKERRARLGVLHAQQSSASQWLTIVCVHLELLLYLSLLFFMFALIPAELNNEFTIFELFDEENIVFITITNMAYFIAISIIAPIYVAAGFALYITRRVKLEGWDIELAFKRMKNRLDGNKHATYNPANSTLALIPFVTCIIFASLSPTQSYADNEPIISKQEAKSVIKEILQHEDFGEKVTKQEWTYVGSPLNEDDDEDSPEWLEKFLKWLFGNLSDDKSSTTLKVFEILIWLALGGFIIWLVNKYSHWLSWITLPSRTKKQAHVIPNKILGMDVTQDSLPSDILASFANHISNKQYREALSLLYRASLSSIIHQGDIEILSSATEKECSEIVANKRSEDEANFFKQLTRAWILLAYADHTPSVDTLSNLRDGWTEHYLNNLENNA